MSQVTPADKPIQSEKELLKSLYKNAKRVTKNLTEEDIKAYANVADDVYQEADVTKKEEKIQKIIDGYKNLCESFEDLSKVIEACCNNTENLFDGMTFKNLNEEVDEKLSSEAKQREQKLSQRLSNGNVESETKMRLNQYNSDLRAFREDLKSITSFKFSEVFLNAYTEIRNRLRSDTESDTDLTREPKNFFDAFSSKANNLLSLTHSSIPERVFDEFFDSMASLLREALDYRESESQTPEEIYREVSARFVKVFGTVVKSANDDNSLPPSKQQAMRIDKNLEMFDKDFLPAFNKLVQALRNDVLNCKEYGKSITDITALIETHSSVKLDSYKNLLTLAYEFAISSDAMSLLEELNNVVKENLLTEKDVLSITTALLPNNKNNTTAQFILNTDDRPDEVQQLQNVQNFVQESVNELNKTFNSIVLFVTLLAGFNIGTLKKELDVYEEERRKIEEETQKLAQQKKAEEEQKRTEGEKEKEFKDFNETESSLIRLIRLIQNEAKSQLIDILSKKYNINADVLEKQVNEVLDVSGIDAVKDTNRTILSLVEAFSKALSESEQRQEKEHENKSR